MKCFYYNSYIFIFQQGNLWKREDIATVRNIFKITGLRKKGLSVNLSDDFNIRKVNLKWKGLDTATNVLSFPNEEKFNNCETNMVYLGDIILAYETIEKERKIKKIDLRKHLAHILVHGILHLKGYTHKSDRDTKLMQNEEIRILKNLKIKNPYIL
ncbi:rRNA maturation RNase YbeY [Pelagibacteraceae bacterium]|nr:rRNA maturation RNase YbeY [Pelagibacteraceae bacterium]